MGVFRGHLSNVCRTQLIKPMKWPGLLPLFGRIIALPFVLFYAGFLAIFFGQEYTCLTMKTAPKFARQADAEHGWLTMRGENSTTGQTCGFLRGLARLPFLFAAVNHGLGYAYDLLREGAKAVCFGGRFRFVFHLVLGIGLCNDATAGNECEPFPIQSSLSELPKLLGFVKSTENVFIAYSHSENEDIRSQLSFMNLFGGKFRSGIDMKDHHAFFHIYLGKKVYPFFIKAGGNLRERSSVKRSRPDPYAASKTDFDSRRLTVILTGEPKLHFLPWLWLMHFQLERNICPEFGALCAKLVAVDAHLSDEDADRYQSADRKRTIEPKLKVRAFISLFLAMNSGLIIFAGLTRGKNWVTVGGFVIGAVAIILMWSCGV